MKQQDESLFAVPMRRALRNFEKMYLEYHFEQCGRRIKPLADKIKVARPHLYVRLRRNGIKLRRNAALTR